MHLGLDGPLHFLLFSQRLILGQGTNTDTQSKGLLGLKLRLLEAAKHLRVSFMCIIAVLACKNQGKEALDEGGFAKHQSRFHFQKEFGIFTNI